MSTSTRGVMRTERGGDSGDNDGHQQEPRSHHFCQPMTVRYIYALLFLLGNIFAWVLRESHVTFFERQRHSGCHDDHDCLAADAVLVISLTCFLFFLVMFFSTVYTRKVQDRRNSWQSQWWPAKIVLLVGCIVVSTFIPSYWIHLYGKVAPFGAGIFLCIQLLSLMRCLTKLNYKWCQTNFETRYLYVIAVSVLAHISATVWIILMSFWYIGCWMNFAFLGTTLLLMYFMHLISMMSKTNGFYMEPALVGLYIVFLCFSAIKSEPETHCYKKGNSGSGLDYWKTTIGFVVAMGSTTVAAFTTGVDYKCIHFRNVVESEDDVPYGYGFFHFLFATGSMYFGMLFLGWDTHHTMDKYSVDVSWTSTWVHIINEGIVVVSFVAILVARIYGIGWLRQLLARIFGIGDQQHQQEEEEEEQPRRRRTLQDMFMSSSNDEEDNIPSSPVELDDISRVVSNDTTDSGPASSPTHTTTAVTPTINLAEVVAILRGKRPVATIHEDADAAGPSSSGAADADAAGPSSSGAAYADAAGASSSGAAYADAAGASSEETASNNITGSDDDLQATKSVVAE